MIVENEIFLKSGNRECMFEILRKGRFEVFLFIRRIFI